MKIVLIASHILVISHFIMRLVLLRVNKTKTEKSVVEQQPKKTNKSAERYASFDLATTLAATLLFLLVIIWFIWFHPKRSTPIVTNEILMLIIAAVTGISSVYALTDNYKDLEAIKALFDNRKPISIDLFSNASSLIGSISMILLSRLDPILSNNNNLSLAVAQWVDIIRCIFLIFIFVYLVLSLIVEIVYICKKYEVNKRVLKRHRKNMLWLYNHIPSRKYISKSHKWKPSRKQYWFYFSLDSLYKTLLSIPLFAGNILIGTYKAIVSLVKVLSALFGVRYSFDNLCTTESYKRFLGWSFIIALTAAYFIINNTQQYSASCKEAYSFIAGIVIIPTIIGTVIQREKN